jgi:hypothetical protein
VYSRECQDIPSSHLSVELRYFGIGAFGVDPLCPRKRCESNGVDQVQRLCVPRDEQDDRRSVCCEGQHPPSSTSYSRARVFWEAVCARQRPNHAARTRIIKQWKVSTVIGCSGQCFLQGFGRTLSKILISARPHPLLFTHASPSPQRAIRRGDHGKHLFK